jgi:ribA/ribD-fused uncharacterized protein
MTVTNVTELKEFVAHAPVEFHFFLKGPLSQWSPSPFVYEGITYPTAEHYMMACKARHFNDLNTLSYILKATTPSEAKDYGRVVRPYDDASWAEVRAFHVYNGNIAKFYSNKKHAELLLSTGDKILVEANPRDNIWGIGLSETDEDRLDPKKWKGENLLGFILMRVRDALRMAR